jgi:DNA replication protein DnaC
VGYLRKNLPLDHPDFGNADACSCWAADRAPRLREHSGLTVARRKIRLEDIVVEGRPATTRMRQACLEFCEQPTGILTLWGGVGNGKTMALHGVVNELNARGLQAVYVTAFALKSHLQEAFAARQEGRGESSYRRLMNFEKVSVLAVDELDKLYVTDWVREQFTDLFDARYQLAEDETAGTLVAMNSDPAQQPEWIASRLLDGCNRVVHNEDRDIRPALAR